MAGKPGLPDSFVARVWPGIGMAWQYLRVVLVVLLLQSTNAIQVERIEAI